MFIALIVIALIVTIFGFIALHKAQGRRRIANSILGLVDAGAPLQPESKAGDTVKVRASICFPHTQTPFLHQPASLWRAAVNAEFSVKARKPQRGTRVVRPLLHQSASHEPLLLSTEDGRVVHVVFSEGGMLGDLLSKNVRVTETLPESLSAKAKPKHERYRIHEEWLPTDATVFVIGDLADDGAGCATVNAAILSRTSESGLVKRYTSSRRNNTAIIVMASLAIPALWVWAIVAAMYSV